MKLKIAFTDQEGNKNVMKTMLTEKRNLVIPKHFNYIFVLGYSLFQTIKGTYGKFTSLSRKIVSYYVKSIAVVFFDVCLELQW